MEFKFHTFYRMLNIFALCRAVASFTIQTLQNTYLLVLDKYSMHEIVMPCVPIGGFIYSSYVVGQQRKYT